MKLKHNKKRNTTFLYEALVKEITKAVMDKDVEKKNILIAMVKEHFAPGTALRKELDLVKALCETKHVDVYTAERLVSESKKQYDTLDQKQLFEEQSQVIDKVNKAVGKQAFNNFVPNYKDLATIGLYFQNSNLGAKKRIMLEDKVVGYLTRLDENQTEMKPVDQLEFKMFVKRFNETYEHSLLREQKDLLSNFIVSFSDNGLGLKSFMNDEIGRLKEAVSSHIDDSDTPLNENFKKVKEKLDGYAKTPITSKIVEEVFYIQDLLAEVKRNAS